MKNSRKLYPILIILAIAFTAYLVAIYSDFAINKNDDKDNSINVTAVGNNSVPFIAEEVGLKISYPKKWKRYYNPSKIYGFALELSSDTRTHNIDPISNQKLTGPLVKFDVFQQPKLSTLSLSDWINQSSTVEDEQTRIRKDKQGYLGYRQWIWHQRNPYDNSSITYYVDKDNYIWEFRATIMENNPQSEQFKESVKIIDKIFNSIEFLNTNSN